MKSVVEILVRARKYVARGWCQKAFAKDSYGNSVQESSSAACRWCAIGAIRQACIDLNLDLPAGWPAIDRLLRAAPAEDLEAWNDQFGQTQQEVIEAFDRAIQQINAEIAEKEKNQ